MKRVVLYLPGDGARLAAALAELAPLHAAVTATDTSRDTFVVAIADAALADLAVAFPRMAIDEVVPFDVRRLLLDEMTRTGQTS